MFTNDFDLDLKYVGNVGTSAIILHDFVLPIRGSFLEYFNLFWDFLVLTVSSRRGCGVLGSRSLRKGQVECSNHSRDRPWSLKRVVTAPLPNARQ